MKNIEASVGVIPTQEKKEEEAKVKVNQLSVISYQLPVYNQK